ncbi:RNA exonuclease 4 [Hypsibius exemplaris]|uniref:RNA exonuclease 4 n=1 Tax=Hypsibius exemplaris TaxID=2072580 RepID=A0A1W0XC44_HYPEX|nr:RNA exonuclease 4 [Hypsibius exemplaris]
MSSNDGPVINITTSRPISIADQRRNQQQPNRNRVIIRRQLPGGGSVFKKVITTRPRPDESQGAERRPAEGRSEIPPEFKWPEPVVETPESRFQQRTRELLGDRSFVPAALERDLQVRNGEGRKTTSVVSAPAVPRKKKIKPPLSVPTSAGQVSNNWKGLQKSLGLRETPRRPPPRAKKDVEEAMDATADGVVGVGADGEAEIPSASADTFVKTKSFSGLTKTVALDCEFVGVGPGGRENMLARVSLVNQFGHCVYDKHVKPTELVKDYRTHVSGIRPQDLKTGEDFKTVQREVSEILSGRTLVGHAVHHDLEVLLLSHPKSDIRDTSKFKPFRQINKGGTPSLKKLTAKVLGFAVQTGEHDSVQDAQATMRLYTMYKREWESKVSLKGKKLRMMQKKNKPALTHTPES